MYLWVWARVTWNYIIRVQLYVYLLRVWAMSFSSLITTVVVECIVEYERAFATSG